MTTPADRITLQRRHDEISARTARTELDGAGADYADRLIAAADRAERDARLARQAANRHAAYERRRPARYATASYASLHQDQDPRGLISTWLTRGPRTLTLVGPSRTGKTWAAYAITNAAHVGTAWVVATSAANLSADLKPDADPYAYDRAVGCDLLLIDDLGRERVTEWWVEQLGRIADERCANVRRLIVTTNADPDPGAAYKTIADKYGDPIAERIIDGGGVVAFDGPAIREVVTSW